MKILITGANGFVGKNLCETLKTIRDGKNRCYPQIHISDIYCCDVETTFEQLMNYCQNADFVFHLAGVNRPSDNSEFMTGNRDFTENLLTILKECGNTAPILLSSSIQASLNNEYGRSKKEAELLVSKYGEQWGVKTYIYRLPNLFGKWCRPNYNSVIATFCHNIANDLPIRIDDRNICLTFAYIDDVIEEFLSALSGNPYRSGNYCEIPTVHSSTLGEIADYIYSFREQTSTLQMPEIPENSFQKKLYSTYLSYLPYEKIAVDLKMNCDERGSFTELLKTANSGQFSVNISKPGIVKGEHWHHTKWEFFMVVSGRGLIQMRKIGDREVIEFYVDGDNIKAVHMLPGYTHRLINLSDTQNLVTLMWANEIFDSTRPDTFGERVIL